MMLTQMGLRFVGCLRRTTERQAPVPDIFFPCDDFAAVPIRELLLDFYEGQGSHGTSPLNGFHETNVRTRLVNAGLTFHPKTSEALQRRISQGDFPWVQEGVWYFVFMRDTDGFVTVARVVKGTPPISRRMGIRELLPILTWDSQIIVRTSSPHPLS